MEELASPETGRHLAAYRAFFGLRQSDIARAWGCSRSNVRRIEMTRRPSPAAIGKYLAAIAELSRPRAA